MRYGVVRRGRPCPILLLLLLLGFAPQAMERPDQVVRRCQLRQAQARLSRGRGWLNAPRFCAVCAATGFKSPPTKGLYRRRKRAIAGKCAPCASVLRRDVNLTCRSRHVSGLR